MKTVQMTLEDELVRSVDRVARKKGMTRSAFTRSALRMALQADIEREGEERHKTGYEKYPVRTGEFDVAEEFKGWPR
ncbi:MAG: CopG family transcriptional regulator [Candidatus Sumerlaeaceae bacterium]